MSGLFTRLVARTLRVGQQLTPRLPTGPESWSGPAGFAEEASEIEAAAAPAPRVTAPRDAPPEQPETPGGEALSAAGPERRPSLRAGEVPVAPGRSAGSGMRERATPAAGTTKAPAAERPAAAASRLVAPAAALLASRAVESAVPQAALPREETISTRAAPATGVTQTPRSDDRARPQDPPAANRPMPQGWPASLPEDLRAPPPMMAATGQLVAPSISVPPASAERARAPDIEISIGQIEVRAPAPLAAVARRAGPARPRAISLADYLAKRDGGSR